MPHDDTDLHRGHIGLHGADSGGRAARGSRGDCAARARDDTPPEAVAERVIEAKEYGYTWHSIRNMVEQILRERGVWRKHWDNWDIQANYYRLMKEAKQQ